MRKSVFIRSLAVVAAAVLLVGAGSLHVSAQQAPEATAQVQIDNFSFEPATIASAPGTTITWTNGDDIPHTVVSEDKAFKSKVLDTGEKFSFTFRQPGSYPYFCSIHPKMTGKVIVH
jgi:plastocyanin